MALDQSIHIIKINGLSQLFSYYLEHGTHGNTHLHVIETDPVNEHQTGHEDVCFHEVYHEEGDDVIRQERQLYHIHSIQRPETVHANSLIMLAVKIRRHVLVKRTTADILDICFPLDRCSRARATWTTAYERSGTSRKFFWQIKSGT